MAALAASERRRFEEVAAAAAAAAAAARDGGAWLSIERQWARRKAEAEDSFFGRMTPLAYATVQGWLAPPEGAQSPLLCSSACWRRPSATCPRHVPQAICPRASPS